MSVLLSVQSLGKSYGPRPLFQNISLDFREAERVGLIGPNGAGKSTLLKILADGETPDAGLRSLRKGIRLGYLPQEDWFPPELTVEHVLYAALEDRELEEHERATRVGITIGKVGFPRRDQKAGELSGGWRKRLAIARALIGEPDLLLMDEPTNHLDLEGILWLEGLLRNAPFAFLLVSHDRYFLERATNRIVELNRRYPEGFYSVNGPYSEFLRKRADFLSGQARQQVSLAGKVRREVEWLKRGPKARSTKATSRIREADGMIQELADLKHRNAEGDAPEIDFVATGRKANRLLAAEDVAKRIADRLLFEGISFMLAPGTKLGLLGPNGSGKTTLLRLLTGALEPDRGKIVRREGLQVVLFDQDREQLDKGLSLRRSLAPNGDTVVYRGSALHIASWAKRFQFRSEQLDLPVGNLSGGEQARILIARLMLRPADVLLLDEPTNDLDIPTLEVLEESLADFPGAIVLVTHDRFMLDRLSTLVLGLDGRGGAHLYADYAQWENAQADAKEVRPKKTPSVEKGTKPPREKSHRLSYPEQREWECMEETILVAEQAFEARQREVEEAAQASDHVKLQECCTRLQTAQENVEKLYARWAELEEKQTLSSPGKKDPPQD